MRGTTAFGDSAVASAPVVICLLGRFRIVRRGNLQRIRAGGKIEQLLGTLALSPPSGLSRRDLLDRIWPEADYVLAGQSLSSLVYSLNRELADTLGGRSLVIVVDGRYRLNLAAGVLVDVDVFAAAADDGEQRARSGDWAGAVDAFTEALRLYAGDLTFGSDVRYLVESERLRARYLAIHATLGEHLFSTGDVGRALEEALALLDHDPCREDAHRLAMRCYVRMGLRSQALRQYRMCRDVLGREFNAVPERSTDELFEIIRQHPDRV